MKIKRAILGFLLFLAGNTAFSAYKYYLPQVAIGSFGTGGFRTSFVFFNNQSSTANVTLALTDDAGNPMVITLPGQGTNSTFTFALSTGESRIYQTDMAGSQGPLKAGAAVVTSDSPIGVSGIFTVVDPQGRFVTETGVGNSELLTEFVVPVQAIGNYNTGLALFNPSAQISSFTAILADKNGSLIGQTNKTLAAGNHMGVFIAGDLFPGVTSAEGTLTIQSSVALSAMTLRQSSSPLSYTSSPVVSKSSTQTTIHLAQVANGGGYRTSFLFFNISASTANVDLSLTKDDGTPLTVAIPGQGSNSTFHFTIEAGKSLFLQTDGTGGAVSGGAKITSNVPIGATGIFTIYDENGNFITEAGIGDSPLLKDFTLPIDYTGSFDTGLALFNPGAAPVTTTLRFLSSDGEVFETTKQIPLETKGHSASFFSQIFPELGTIQGTLAISAPSGIAPLTMRFNSASNSLTSLPVASGSSPGRSLGPAIGDPVVSSLSGISATANVALNKTLRPGYHLSGGIKGGIYPYYTVTAQSSSRTYTDAGPFPANYNIVLPTGTYTLKAIVATVASGSVEGTLISYTHPTPVNVANNTTLDITIPPPVLFTVSGSITGMNKIPASSLFRLTFISTDNTVIGYGSITDGNYHALLPAGDYSIGILALSVPSGGFNEDLGISTIGSIHVSGVTAQNLIIPDMAALSGTAGFTGSMPGQAIITAIDTSNTSDFSLISGTTILSVSSGFNGAYQMLLAKDRTYSMAISYPLSGGNVQFPLTASTVAVAGDTSYNFAIPALPGEVQISGKVADNTGKGLSGVTIAATAESLTGASNAGFITTTTTDSNGNYSIKVLNGRYRLTFTPPNLP
jgi:hypothetical protein